MLKILSWILLISLILIICVVSISENNNELIFEKTYDQIIMTVQAMPTKTPFPTLVFNPPIEVELISLIGNSESRFEYVSAGTTIGNLYNFDHNRGPLSTIARELERNGEAAYISTHKKVLLMKIEGDYAYVQLREQSFALRPGVVIIYRENILSYPNKP